MFYEQTPDRDLRFGDVLEGFVSTTPLIQPSSQSKEYQIDINLSQFSVVLSPCCEIPRGDGAVSITPLIKIRNAFFKNSYFLEDLTRINKKMLPQQSVASDIWDNFPSEEQQRRLEKGLQFACLECFVYEKSSLFTEYDVFLSTTKTIKTNSYMIDFRNIYKISCAAVKKIQQEPFTAKRLQLTKSMRSELRDKISFYYGRPPDEDLV